MISPLIFATYIERVSSNSKIILVDLAQAAALLPGIFES